ncbi:MAG: DUF4160 domain-containing protein [Emticicia sp.]
MPIISFFDGIKVLLFSNNHLPPHFHVYYAEYKALIAIDSLQIMRGDLPTKQLNKVVEWAGLNKENLLETFYQLNPSLRK